MLVLEQCVVYNTDYKVCVEEETPHFKITMNFFKEVVTEGHELHVNFVIVLGCSTQQCQNPRQKWMAYL